MWQETALYSYHYVKDLAASKTVNLMMGGWGRADLGLKGTDFDILALQLHDDIDNIDK